MILMGAGDTVGHKGEEVLCCQLRLFMPDRAELKDRSIELTDILYRQSQATHGPECKEIKGNGSSFVFMYV